MNTELMDAIEQGLRARIRELEAQNEAFDALTAANQKRIEELEEAVDSAEREGEMIQDTEHDLQDRISALQTENQDAWNELNAAERRIAKAKAILEEALPYAERSVLRLDEPMKNALAALEGK